MKKIISFFCISVLSIMLVGCGDDEFVKFAKEAIKDQKEWAMLYDFKNNKFYQYHTYSIRKNQEPSFIIDRELKNCSVSKEEINKVILSDDSINLTCDSYFVGDLKVKVKIVGKKSSYDQNILDNDFNYLFNFNTNKVYYKISGDTDEQMKKNAEKTKSSCHSKDKEIYDNCGLFNSRVKIIGL
ncbi:hypothetical protein [Gilliamella sp. Imp1-1]|uniref:hypothetical protein n=1 Tax=Gilliamella sp. Imp1-1 TaxID=3120248 RepID=UPI0005569314|nr:hypothetical protein [Gilliamella apicola]OCG54833.1 hypothetical protein A9G38_02375 [Gilliamella apicola]